MSRVSSRSCTASFCADLLDYLIEADVLVVITESCLGRRGEDRVGQPRRLDEALGQRDAAHCAGVVVVDQAGAGEEATNDAFDGNHVEGAHHERAAENLFRDAIVVGLAGQVVGATEDVEEEHAHRGEHATLVRDRRAEHVVVGRDPITRDKQQMLVVDRVKVTDLATGQMSVGIKCRTHPVTLSGVRSSYRTPVAGTGKRPRRSESCPPCSSGYAGGPSPAGERPPSQSMNYWFAGSFDRPSSIESSVRRAV